MFEYDSRTRTVEIIGYAEPINNNDKFSERGVMNAYMEQAVLYSALPDEERHDVLKYMDTRDENDGKTTFLQEYIPHADMDVYLQEMCEAQPDATGEKGDFAQYLGKKYKPVALKVKPMYSDLPEKFRIKRDIKGDLLTDMPELKTYFSRVHSYWPIYSGTNGTIHRIAPGLLVRRRIKTITPVNDESRERVCMGRIRRRKVQNGLLPPRRHANNRTQTLGVKEYSNTTGAI